MYIALALLLITVTLATAYHYKARRPRPIPILCPGCRRNPTETKDVLKAVCWTAVLEIAKTKDVTVNCPNCGRPWLLKAGEYRS